MRIEMEEQKEKIQEVDHEDLAYKHESDLTRKERRLLEKQKLSSMSFSEKLQYIWAYYKAVIFGAIGAVLLVFIAFDAYDRSKIQTILSVMVVNSTGDFDQELKRDMEAVFGAEEDKYRIVELSANVNTNQEGTELSPYAQMAFVTKIHARTIDALVMPESFFSVLEEQEYFMDLPSLLGEEVYEAFGDSISDKCITLEDPDLARGLGVAYEPICIGVLANGPNEENTALWLKSLL